MLYSLESRQKSQKLQTGFPRHWEEFLKIFNAVRITTERALMIYHSTQSDDYLWYLILRVKQKEKKLNCSLTSFEGFGLLLDISRRS